MSQEVRHLFTKRPGGGFFPTDADGKAWADTVGIGEEVFLRPARPRNPQQHRKMFALLNFVMDSTERFPNMAALLLWLKIQVGHYAESITKDGEIVYEAKSISFASMSQDQFQPFYADALETIRRELLPTMTDADMEAALNFYEGNV